MLDDGCWMLDVETRNSFCVSDCSENPAVKMARAKRALVFTRNCSEKRGIFCKEKAKEKNTRQKKCNFGLIFENFP
jgi:hypothetical protein